MSYAAILSRAMNIDLVNLGFGGAGKAEPEVAALVAQVDACCYLLDLGKSYGRQSAEAYTALLTTLRQAHPNDLGHSLIAERLRPTIERALQAAGQATCVSHTKRTKEMK